MKALQVDRKLPMALVFSALALACQATALVITSLDVVDEELVFTTPNDGTTHHLYRIESSTTPDSQAWTMRRTVDGVGPGTSVSNRVATDAATMFYRVVSSLNSADYVDGPYMVIDVSSGPASSEYPVSHYDSAAEVPGGVDHDLYKTTHILMRRIPAGTFTMGSPEGELGRSSNEGQREVTLTKDYDIGVFQVTQKQWERVMGDWPSWFSNPDYRETRPLEDRSWNNIRGGTWPGSPSGSGHPGAGTFVQLLRAKTGLLTLDLPTEAQWERASRAGTGTAVNSGKDLTKTDSCPNMSEVARYWFNGGSGYTQNGTTAVATAKVGSYLPNAWGLHDMHGNVWEWCLDWYTDSPTGTTDPLGDALGSHRASRGGSWYNYARFSRSAYRGSSLPAAGDAIRGFRLARTLP